MVNATNVKPYGQENKEGRQYKRLSTNNFRHMINGFCPLSNHCPLSMLPNAKVHTRNS